MSKLIFALIAPAMLVMTFGLLSPAPAEACTYNPDTDPNCLPHMMFNMVLDCNTNNIAESSPQTVEVVYGQPILWEDWSGLYNVMHWMDPDGLWWIRLSDARRDGSGNLLSESPAC